MSLSVKKIIPLQNITLLSTAIIPNTCFFIYTIYRARVVIISTLNTKTVTSPDTVQWVIT